VASDEQTLADFVYVILGSTEMVLKSFLTLKTYSFYFELCSIQTLRDTGKKNRSLHTLNDLKSRKKLSKNDIFGFYFNTTAKHNSFDSF
jgi:hypothetical protein